MLHVGVDVSFKNVTIVLEACAVELQRNKDKIANPGPKDDVETIMVHNNIFTFNVQFNF